jgi:hypothetical protein
MRVETETAADIWRYVKEPSQEIPMLRSRFDESEGALSPDSHWLAYVSNAARRRDVYIRSLERQGSGGDQLAIADGWSPRWSRTGAELFFVRANHIWVAPVIDPATIRLGTPYQLLGEGFELRGGSVAFDVAPDGRFIVTRSVTQPQSVAFLECVLPWNGETRRELANSVWR